MDNVQAATSTPSPAPAKACATEVAVDDNGAPLPGAFMAVLTQQVKSLKAGFKPGTEGTDASATDADPAKGSTDSTLPAQPAAIALPLLAALPPALMPAILQATAAAAASPAAAALTLAAAAASALASPAASATAPKQALAAKLPAFPGDAQSTAAAGSGLAPDAARKSEAGNAPAPLPAPAHDPLTAGATADLAARAELLGAAEHTPLHGADGRENNAQTVPQLAFTQAFNEARPAASVTPAAQLQLDTPLGMAAWSTELGQRVVWMVGEKQHVAELRINPPDLGPLDIKLTVDDHQTTAVFTSPHASVRDALESALPRLREVLAESGIMLGNASVTADSPRDGSAFAPPPPRTPGAAGNESSEAAATRLAPNAGSAVRGRGLVDLFA
jgi:flagellar hook-length control protein FliK